MLSSCAPGTYEMRVHSLYSSMAVRSSATVTVTIPGPEFAVVVPAMSMTQLQVPDLAPQVGRRALPITAFLLEAADPDFAGERERRSRFPYRLLPPGRWRF